MEFCISYSTNVALVVTVINIANYMQIVIRFSMIQHSAYIWKSMVHWVLTMTSSSGWWTLTCGGSWHVPGRQRWSFRVLSQWRISHSVSPLHLHWDNNMPSGLYFSSFPPLLLLFISLLSLLSRSVNVCTVFPLYIPPSSVPFPSATSHSLSSDQLYQFIWHLNHCLKFVCISGMWG